MSHEFECWLSNPDAPEDAKRDGEFCECDIARKGYQRGYEDACKSLEPYLSNMTAQIKAVQNWHKPEMVNEQPICVGCSDVATGVWVGYPCRTILVLLEFPCARNTRHISQKS